MLTINEHFYSLALFAYILSELFFATLRWFHMCHPFDENPSYYYPERKDATWMHLGAIILLPHVINPSNTDAWTYVKAYFIILPTFFSGYLSYKYFGTIKRWQNWKKFTFALSIPFSLTIFILFLITISPTWNISPSIKKELIILVYVEGIVSTIYCLRAIFRVRNWLQTTTEDYSNVEDFPINNAKRILIVPLIQIVTIWFAVLIGSKVIMALLFLELTIVNVITLLFVLSPELEKTQEIEKSSHAPEDDDNLEDLSEEVNLIIASIKKVVEEEQEYLNPHLSLQDIADRCHYGRTYVSYVFKNHLGGFFNYVNTLRLSHSDAYIKNHPMATLDEVAIASGFSSRQSLYRVRQRLKKQPK